MTRKARKDTFSHRMQVDADESTKALCEELITRSGSRTFSEAFRRALACFDAFLKCVKAGGKVILEDKDGRQTEIRFF